MTRFRFFAPLAALAGAAFVSSVASSALAADPLDSWQTSALSSASAPNLGFGNGAFFAPGTKVGAANVDLRKSADGITWTAPMYMGQQPTAAFGFGNGTIVMGTRDGAILSSTDGTTWTNRFAIPQVTNSGSVANIAYGGGTWIVTTMGARYYSSTDLVTFTLHEFAIAGAAQHPYSLVATSQGTFVATSGSGISSFDGTVWRLRSSGPSGFTVLAAGSAGVLAAGASGVIATSPDGITWTAQPPVDTNPAMNASIVLTGAAYGSGGWVVVGNSGSTPVVYASPDGVTFRRHTIPAGTAKLESIVFGNGKYLVSGLDTTANHASAYASGVYAAPINLANAPTLTNPKPVVIPTAPNASVGVRHL